MSKMIRARRCWYHRENAPTASSIGIAMGHRRLTTPPLYNELSFANRTSALEYTRLLLILQAIRLGTLRTKTDWRSRGIKLKSRHITECDSTEGRFGMAVLHCGIITLSEFSRCFAM